MNERERQALAAICEAFHPSLAAEPGDDAALFATGASEIGVPAAAEAAIALLPAAERAELSRLLRTMDGPLLGLLTARVFRGFTAMSADERERMLLALATHPLPQLRSGFQALKRLSSFLQYSITDGNGQNALWPSIGYGPSPKPPARPEPLRLTTFAAPTTVDCDVCIIGSGAGGGVVAAELAAKGLKIVVLEAGPPDQAADFAQREIDGTQRLYLDHGLAATRDVGVSILAGACLGGGTAVNWQTSLRTPDFVREEWSELSDSDLFTSSRFTRALDSVCARSGVSTDASMVNANNAPLQRGCAALDYEWTPIARNSRGCDPSQCGYCTFGCRLGGKQSTTVTYLHDAQQTGDTTIVASCRADRLTIANGRVTGVDATYTDAAGRRVAITVRATKIAVCAGGIQSPALLQRSNVHLPQLGRNLFLHPTSAVGGFYAEPVEAWNGPPQTILSSQFARADGNFGFRLEAAPVHPGLMASAIPWTGARAHRQLMQQCAHASALVVLTRDCEGGRVRTRRDGTATIDYRPGAAERALLARGIAEAARVHLAAGADEVITFHANGPSLRRADIHGSADIDAFCDRIRSAPLDRNRAGLFSAHQMSTCRMGRGPDSAVCDETGEVFGVHGLFIADASAFPASSGVNPMITVMALAKCVAESI